MADDDAKEWVTIKVPKRVRDAAREDPRTYGEILRAGMDGDADITATVRPEIDEDALAEIEAKLDDVADDAGEALTDGLKDQLDRIEAGVGAIEDRTGTIEDHLGARYG